MVRLPLAGEHNARNAAAALAVVLALGLPARPAAAAMERVVLPAHRSRFLPHAAAATCWTTATTPTPARWPRR